LSGTFGVVQQSQAVPQLGFVNQLDIIAPSCRTVSRTFGKDHDGHSGVTHFANLPSASLQQLDSHAAVVGLQSAGNGVDGRWRTSVQLKLFLIGGSGFNNHVMQNIQDIPNRTTAAGATGREPSFQHSGELLGEFASQNWGTRKSP
jgi:hypothetical protein